MTQPFPRTAAFTLALACVMASVAALAQQPQPPVQPQAQSPSAKASPKGSSSAAKVAMGPTWAELTPPQQQALKPLQGNWSSLTEAHKRKWLALSATYPKMPAPEQARLHSRMTEWANLSTKERTEARLNFAEARQHSTGEKQAKWQAYQQLSPEEKQKLAAGKPKAQGAAPAVKPVPAQKLAVVPPTHKDQKQHPAIAGTSGRLDHNTLLPQPLPTPTGAPAQTN